MGLEEFISFRTPSGERGLKVDRDDLLWIDFGVLGSVFCGGWLKDLLMSSTFFSK